VAGLACATEPSLGAAALARLRRSAALRNALLRLRQAVCSPLSSKVRNIPALPQMVRDLNLSDRRGQRSPTSRRAAEMGDDAHAEGGLEGRGILHHLDPGSMAHPDYAVGLACSLQASPPAIAQPAGPPSGRMHLDLEAWLAVYRPFAPCRLAFFENVRIARGADRAASQMGRGRAPLRKVCKNVSPSPGGISEAQDNAADSAPIQLAQQSIAAERTEAKLWVRSERGASRPLADGVGVGSSLVGS